MGYIEQKTKMDRLLLPHNIRKCINLVVDFHWLEIVNISMLTLTTIIILLFHLVYILGANLGLFVAMPEC